MDDLAAAAATSKSVFYRYFGDKAGLQYAVGEVVIASMQEAVLSAAEGATTPRQGLKNMVTAYLTMAATSPNVYAFVTQNSLDGTMSNSGSMGLPADLSHASGALGSFFHHIVAMVAAPMEGQLGGSAAPTARYWPTAAIGLVRTVGELWLADSSQNRPEAETLAEDITSWLFEGIHSHGALSATILSTPATPSVPERTAHR